MKKRLFTFLFIVSILGVFAGILFHVKWLDYLCKPLIMISIGGCFLLNSKKLDKHISDTLIAFDQFYAAIPNDRIFVMSTYIAAQYLIKRGILRQFE